LLRTPCWPVLAPLFVGFVRRTRVTWVQRPVSRVETGNLDLALFKQRIQRQVADTCGENPLSPIPSLDGETVGTCVASANIPGAQVLASQQLAIALHIGVCRRPAQGSDLRLLQFTDKGAEFQWPAGLSAATATTRSPADAQAW
jgi:hypothetical protein